MSDDTRPPPDTSSKADGQAPDSGDRWPADLRESQLREQEQLWFSWLTVLHERLNQAKPGDPEAAEGREVLEIARQRWLAAKEALREYRSEG
jgi:hypothetical protein